MNTKQTEALKLALEALEHMCMHTRAKVGYRNKLIGEAMDKAREALAEQPAQQEPVAHCEAGPECCPVCHKELNPEPAIYPDEAYEMGLEEVAFYTSPPASKPLTNEQALQMSYKHEWLSKLGMREAYRTGIRDAESAHGIGTKLREKNTGELK